MRTKLPVFIGLSVVIALLWLVDSDPAITQITASSSFNFDTNYTIRDIMAAMGDPVAIVLWNPTDEYDDNGGFIIPDDDDVWANLRNNAVMLGEMANLINMPGRLSDQPGQQASSVEMSAEQIEALINTKRVEWEAFSRAMFELSRKYYQAAVQRDASAYAWEGLGEQLNNICTGCHQQFWYPE